jgi:hypothetical protein
VLGTELGLNTVWVGLNSNCSVSPLDNFSGIRVKLVDRELLSISRLGTWIPDQPGLPPGFSLNLVCFDQRKRGNAQKMDIMKR